jgi:hypothetical protein
MAKKAIIDTIVEEEKDIKRKAIRKKLASIREKEKEEKAKLELLEKQEIEKRKLNEEYWRRNYQLWYEEQQRIFESQKIAYEAWLKKDEYNRSIYQKATNYLSEIYIKLKNYKPEYSPLGFYFKDEKWDTELNPNGTETKGIIRSKLFKEPLQIECVFIWKEYIQSLNELLLDDAIDTEKKDQFKIKCFLINELDVNMVSAIKGFRHSNYSVYFFDLKKEKLVYNKKDKKTDLFSNWFKIDKRPPSIKELIIKMADENGMFTKKDLVNKLKLKSNEATKLIEHLIERNKIVDVEHGKYAFI